MIKNAKKNIKRCQLNDIIRFIFFQQKKKWNIIALIAIIIDERTYYCESFTSQVIIINCIEMYCTLEGRNLKKKNKQQANWYLFQVVFRIQQTLIKKIINISWFFSIVLFHALYFLCCSQLTWFFFPCAIHFVSVFFYFCNGLPTKFRKTCQKCIEKQD